MRSPTFFHFRWWFWRLGLVFCAGGLLALTTLSPLDAAPRGKAAPPRDAAKRPPRAEEPPREEPLPGSGTQRVALPRVRPIRMQGTGTGGGAVGPVRPTAAHLAATQPQREAARELALATLKQPRGAAQVARMAAADVGPRSEEAARVLGERGDVVVFRRLAQHGDAEVRVGLARALSHRPQLAPAFLGELLSDWSIKVLRAAVQTAAKVGSPKHVERLAFLALRHDRSIQGAALRALAMHALVPAAKRTLIAALTHANPAVRQAAVAAVGAARSPWVLPYLRRLARDPSEALRRRVAQALGRMPPGDEPLRLLDGLARDRSSEVRREAQRARADLLRARRAMQKAGRVTPMGTP